MECICTPEMYPCEACADKCTCFPDLAMTLGGSYEGTPDPNCIVHRKV